MPRGRCHFALLAALHERFHLECPEAAALADAHTPDLLAGTCAPDGLRFVGKRGKFATHFYSDDRRDTWGRSVAGLFGANPDLADPRRLSGADVAMMLGYISHLTVDEAFRDEVTVHVYGIEDWRPIIMGSVVHGGRIRHRQCQLHGSDSPIRPQRQRRLYRLRGCGRIPRPGQALGAGGRPLGNWSAYFSGCGRCDAPEHEARRTWERNVAMAAPFLDDARRMRFHRAAVDEGMEETLRYLKGNYALQKRGD